MEYVELDNIPDGWELWSSIDHDLLPADETMMVEIANTGALVMGAILNAVGCDISRMDTWEAACEQVAPYEEGWAEPTEDDPYMNRVPRLHEAIVWYTTWDQGVTGIAIQSDNDCGMTWILHRVER